MHEKVLAAMSGGVDSSVAAALLLKQGYEVTGAVMRLFPDSRAHEDAQRVAFHLGIPIKILDFSDLFEEKVVRSFIHEYLSGRTPNPCIACNRVMKFGQLLDMAVESGFDAVATGHYARLAAEPGKPPALMKALDRGKDQSYFLYGLRREVLSRILFPLGAFRKQEVREMAASLHIPVAAKNESQEICFISDNDHARFIRERAGSMAVLSGNTTMQPGNLTDKTGKVLGRHEGLYTYTIGQRRGLGLSMGKRVFVTGMDPKSGTVTIGNEEDLYSEGLLAGHLNWLQDPMDIPREILVKIRSRAPETPAFLELLPSGQARVIFHQPQRAVTPGQSAVFYHGEQVLGGGIIAEVLSQSGKTQ
ncbi:MAG TPA: tRNA 2-thiouridine(34) synthase MnmA [Clostridiales bacterium]|nr:tRNA 2-thiouridine(34) synthase MnmA [Clostridiales bacterium]